MINHAYRMLYGLSDRGNISGIFVDTTYQVLLPDVLRSLWARLSGETVEGADAFAVSCLKILDGSSFRGIVTETDPRITYDIELLMLPVANMLPFIQQLIGVSPAALQYVFQGNPEFETTFRRSDTTQEVAASVIAGYISKVTEYNVRA